jgi:endonuclease/exonuclease/phosphatase (EEP) superfamily protein YafD
LGVGIVSGIAAIVLVAVAVPSLVARALGGEPPNPLPRLAALAPLAACFAAAGVAVAAIGSWTLALLLACPASVLVAWQIPPRKPRRIRSARKAPTRPNVGPDSPYLTVMTLNLYKGAADAAAVVRNLVKHRVDVLAVQELTPEAMADLVREGVADLLPYSHVDPRVNPFGDGLWARWPLVPLPPLARVTSAAPRARITVGGQWPVTVTAVHPIAPVAGNERRWQADLAQIRSGLANTDGLQIVAGDFNASRDHRPFRDLLAVGLIDCADAAQRRSLPGYTWPTDRSIPAIMRLDHVLVSGTGIRVHESQLISIPGTDHRGVLAVLECEDRAVNNAAGGASGPPG